MSGGSLDTRYHKARISNRYGFFHGASLVWCLDGAMVYAHTIDAQGGGVLFPREQATDSVNDISHSGVGLSARANAHGRADK